MKRLFNALWKKRLLRASAAISVLAGTLLIVGLARYNFPQEKFPRLAWLQVNMGINQPANQQRHERPRIIGHRGSGLMATDGSGIIGNTLQAIRTGVDAEADWIEIDVRRSQDGVLMVFHDWKVDRCTSCAGRFDQFGHEDLQALRINVNPVETIPTLTEVLEQFSAQGPGLILDLKVGNLKNELLPLLEKHCSRDRIILFGTYDVLREYVGCGYKLGYTALVSEGWNTCRFAFGHSFILHRCDELDCDYLILPAVFLNQSLIDVARSNGLVVWAYGMEDKRDWQHSIKRGITGLIVDQPRNAVNELRPP